MPSHRPTNRYYARATARETLIIRIQFAISLSPIYIGQIIILTYTICSVGRWTTSKRNGCKHTLLALVAAGVSQIMLICTARGDAPVDSLQSARLIIGACSTHSFCLCSRTICMQTRIHAHTQKRRRTKTNYWDPLAGNGKPW